MQLESYILNSKEDLYRAFEYAASLPANYFALDLETDGVLEKTANIYGVGFCFSATEAFYIPIRAKDGTELWDNNVLFDIKSFIQKSSKKHKLLGHNIIYDTLVLIHHWDLDIVMDIYADTILMKHCLDENPPFGLKEIGEQYFGPEAVKAQKALYDNIEANGGKTTKENLQMFKADTEVLGTYCTWDVALTARLFELFTPRLKEEGLEDLFYKDEIMPLYREVVIPMKRKGFPVDVEHFKKLKHDIELDLVRLENTIYENIKEDIVDFELELLDKAVKITHRSTIGKALIEKGLITKQQLETQGSDGFVKKLSSTLHSSLALDIKNPQEILSTIKELHLSKTQEKTLFNINSTQHLAWLFYTHFNLPVEERTEKGAPKLSAAVLEEMSVDHPIAKQIIEYKKLQKLLSTYVEGILDRQHDGVLYASFLLFGTTSGRFSSRNPNLQNLPRVKEDDSGLSPLVLKYVNAIKEGLVAGKGYKLINSDYSQLEPCAFACASGDKKLQQVFIKKQDLYSAIAVESFGLSQYSADKKATNFLKNHAPEARQKAKVIALATVYGAEAGRISQLLNCSREEAQSIIDAYMNAYPELRTYMADCDKQVKTLGYVKTKFGRIRHLPKAKEIYNKFGDKILDWRWAKQRGLTELRGSYKNELNNAKNFPIQGIAAHIVNRAMLQAARNFKRAGLDATIIATVHDEICCIAPETQANDVKRELQDAMENTVTLEVPLSAEPLIGDNWAEAK